MLEFEGISFTCPFCGEDAALGVLGDDPAMAHAVPYCRAFEEYDYITYAAAVKKAHQDRGKA